MRVSRTKFAREIQGAQRAQWETYHYIRELQARLSESSGLVREMHRIVRELRDSGEASVGEGEFHYHSGRGYKHAL